MIGFYDILLVLVVSAQATLVAYLYQPKWKAMAMTLPIPFTFAMLALRRPVDTTNVMGSVLLLAFLHGIRVLHYTLRVPIVLAIAVNTLGYCLAGLWLAALLPASTPAFWVACVSAFVLAIFILKVQPHRDEQGHRTPLPVWIKLPIIVAVVIGLVLIKNGLRGFMTVFPMVSVIGTYEARHSLWTLSRQTPVIIITLLSLIIICRLTQDSLNLTWSLVLGWVVFLGIIVPVVGSRSNQ